MNDINDLIEHLTDSNVKRNLAIMAAVKRTARDLLLSSGFEEIDTPVLMPRTGEIYNGTFDITLDGGEAMLADSPQIYKMLLTKASAFGISTAAASFQSLRREDEMLLCGEFTKAGYDKYFQFAHCFRSISNENNLHTRLSEFIQLDIELNGTSLDGLIELAETIILKICGVLQKTVKITRMQGLDCRSEYGGEMNPDLRTGSDEISLVIVKNMPLTNDGNIPCHHIFAMPSAPELIGGSAELTELTTESFDIIMNGIEIGGGDMRVDSCELQTRLMRIFGVDEKRYANYLRILEEYGGGQSGGFALGLERLVMALSGAEDIRQTTAFPDYYKNPSA